MRCEANRPFTTRSSKSLSWKLSSDSDVWRKWDVKQIDHLPQDHYNAQVENYPVAVMFDENEMWIK